MGLYGTRIFFDPSMVMHDLCNPSQHVRRSVTIPSPKQNFSTPRPFHLDFVAPLNNNFEEI